MACHRRGPWSHSEDGYLMSLVQTHGPLNWVRIAQTLGSRTPKQCRERYHQNLKPSLNHEPISAEEGAQIERLVQEIGKRWAEIARRLHGRSDNAVKNWWNGSQNRRKRLDRRRSAQPCASFDGQYPRTSMPLGPAPIQSPVTQQYKLPSPSPWREITLPSPCSSEPADSDIGSNYTTSPTRTSRLLQPPVELPPLRALPTSTESNAPLPSLSSLPKPTHSGGSRSGDSSQQAPMVAPRQLLTAPNSPVQSLDTNVGQHSNYPRPPQQQRPGSVDRDSRMNLSSLLI